MTDTKFHLVGLTGKAGSGKDTFAKFLQKQDVYRKVAFADTIKDMLCVMLGVTREKLEDRKYKEATNLDLLTSPRYMLQTLGTEWGRELIHKDIWNILTKRKIEHYLQYRNVVVTDVRFDNEADMIRSKGGVIVHMLRNDSNKMDHASEAGITMHSIDWIIHNKLGLTALEIAACRFHRDISMARIIKNSSNGGVVS